MVRLGKTRAERKLFFRLNKERRELERRGFEPGPKLLAERLGVSEREVTEMQQRLSEPELALNAPVRRDGSSAELGDFVAGAGTTAEQDVGDAQMRRVFMDRVREFAKELDERDRRILEERILSEEPRTLQELGEAFGVTRERVRQLEARLVARLSEYLKQHLVDFEFYAATRD
jgi:RNA polymerase sigma-32 factor